MHGLSSNITSNNPNRFYHQQLLSGESLNGYAITSIYMFLLSVCPLKSNNENNDVARMIVYLHEFYYEYMNGILL